MTNTASDWSNYKHAASDWKSYKHTFKPNACSPCNIKTTQVLIMTLRAIAMCMCIR